MAATSGIAQIIRRDHLLSESGKVSSPLVAKINHNSPILPDIVVIVVVVPAIIQKGPL
jgi:hypothetical protein